MDSYLKYKKYKAKYKSLFAGANENPDEDWESRDDLDDIDFDSSNESQQDTSENDWHPRIQERQIESDPQQQRSRDQQQQRLRDQQTRERLGLDEGGLYEFKPTGSKIALDNLPEHIRNIILEHSGETTPLNREHREKIDKLLEPKLQEKQREFDVKKQREKQYQLEKQRQDRLESQQYQLQNKYEGIGRRRRRREKKSSF